MYVITFYSFKGGVGRTLALANVGAQLALQGKSVLLVDFDLEAPGLDSFPAFRAHKNDRGIVEFVTDYLETGIAPLASDYLANCELEGLGPGKLTLMRSGSTDRTYSSRLSKINWQTLYSERDGYLLFEDLKEQWRQQLRPDYVLIDSRTGHTDVGGICTRQLPDAVVACFIPNEENIGGLETVATDIRAQSNDPDGRNIALHFVVSNVPYLDDENQILAKRLKQAEERLGFQHAAGTIHRYESLSLLENVLFVQTRPRTRLAREYRDLASVITSQNLEDREVALHFLANSEPYSMIEPSNRDLSTTIAEIQVFHPNDGEVLHATSRVAKRLGREDEARLLIQRATALGFRNPEIILDSAQEHLRTGDAEGVFGKVEEALNHPAADYFAVSRAVELSSQTCHPRVLASIAQSLAFQKLQVFEQTALCDQMLVGPEALPFVETILRVLLERDKHLPARRNVKSSLMLCLIGQGKFKEAAFTLSKERPNPNLLGMVDAFNYAIAEWGVTRTPPVDFFERVLDLVPKSETERGKNVSLCLSISEWVVGDVNAAAKYAHASASAADHDSAHAFSGWRYLHVDPAQFREDVRELQHMLEGNNLIPKVLRVNWA